eukprot:COSAG02_NODE_378_length_23535_cov_35.310164_13_plen_92_part_00
MTDIISSSRLQSRLMFIVVSADGRVMANMTSGVDAHLIQKVTPGASTWKCDPNIQPQSAAGRGNAATRLKEFFGRFSGRSGVLEQWHRDHA